MDKYFVDKSIFEIKNSLPELSLEQLNNIKNILDKILNERNNIVYIPFVQTSEPHINGTISIGSTDNDKYHVVYVVN